MGGAYSIFTIRPLRDQILIYAAHDSRYMQVLYESYIQNLDSEWFQRVMLGSSERANWWYGAYVRPSSDAPDF